MTIKDNLPDCVPYEQMSIDDLYNGMCENCSVPTKGTSLCNDCARHRYEEDCIDNEEA